MDDDAVADALLLRAAAFWGSKAVNFKLYYGMQRLKATISDAPICSGRQVVRAGTVSSGWTTVCVPRLLLAVQRLDPHCARTSRSRSICRRRRVGQLVGEVRAGLVANRGEDRNEYENRSELKYWVDGRTVVAVGKSVHPTR